MRLSDQEALGARAHVGHIEHFDRSNLTKTLKTITILTLREENFFKSTRSGVINAYNIASKIFHVSSPRFESVLRRRVDYVLNLLESEDEEISKVIKQKVDLSINKSFVKMLFKIVRQSVRYDRPTGREILQFMDDISGGDIRQALSFFNKLMTSGNTDVNEMLSIEVKGNPSGDPYRGYFIPYHHIIRSIILEDSRYYLMSQSFFMNLFDVNPEYTNSHFTHLRVLEYLRKRLNNYSRIGKGYTAIQDILQEASDPNSSRTALVDSIGKLVEFGLVEFDNQSKTGLEKATYVRITRNGLYYLDRLVMKFAYLDLMWGDTPISDSEVVRELRTRVNVDDMEDEMEQMKIRFERTEQFLHYLKESETKEWNEYPEMRTSALTQDRFMDGVLTAFGKERDYILDSMLKRRRRYGPPLTR